MRKYLLFFLLLSVKIINAQKVEAIFVNLYTDSLKKGTYNYINIDGKLSNGKYIPLDSTKILFTSPQVKFIGNNLVVPIDFKEIKVSVKATLKEDTTIFKEFDIYVKQMEDPPLKTIEEIKTINTKGKKKKSKK